MAQDINYKRIEKAIEYIANNFRQQPSLEEMAKYVNLSEFHFQRLFTEWAGISPKKFLQFLTVEELKKELEQTRNIVDAAYNVGLSAQSRVYDLFVNIESVTPYEYKTKGAGITIEYGIHQTRFGECLIAATERGICSINFVDNNSDVLIDNLKDGWANASFISNPEKTKLFAEQIFESGQDKNLKLLLKGTKFQLKVWEALLKIPFGSVVNYRTIAGVINEPAAVRAVGTAVGCNPVAYVIPCHRVIRREGIIGQYHWGTVRKTAIIGWEKAQLELN